FPDKDSFDAAVRACQIEVYQADTWRPDVVVLPCPRVRITCEDFESQWHEDEQEAEEPFLELVADNGESFTAGELLFKVHNAVVVRWDLGDHVFVEGFTLRQGPEQGGTPLYEMNMGS